MKKRKAKNRNEASMPHGVMMVGRPGFDTIFIDFDKFSLLTASPHFELYLFALEFPLCNDCVQLIVYGLIGGANGGPVVLPPKLSGISALDKQVVDRFIDQVTEQVDAKIEAEAKDEPSRSWIHGGPVPSVFQ